MDNSKKRRKIGWLEEKGMWINVDNFVEKSGEASYILELPTKKESYPQVIHTLSTKGIGVPYLY